MYKSYIKITILIFLILYTFEVCALPSKLTTNSTNINEYENGNTFNLTSSDDNVNTRNENEIEEWEKDKIVSNPEKELEAEMNEDEKKVDQISENDRKETEYNGEQDDDQKLENKNDEDKLEIPTDSEEKHKDNLNDGSYRIGKTDEEDNNNNLQKGQVNMDQGVGNVENVASDKEAYGIGDLFKEFGSLIVAVGAVSVGLAAISGFKVLRRKSEIKSLKKTDFTSSSTSIQSLTPPSLMKVSDYNNSRMSLVNSLISEGEQEGNMLYYSARSKFIENGQPKIKVEQKDRNPQYRMSIQSEGSTSDKSVTVISINRNSGISRNSVIRHSFLNPNLNIVRIGNRTQQLYEATSDHPAIIETFPSLERPFVPSVPIPLEESDINSLHPHSIYQMYQDEMEYENYYAYTIDDKEYIIDPTTNRVLEIHDLNTDEYMLVEEELYLDFSGSSDDSDSDKQTI